MNYDELLGKLNPVLTVNNITKQYEAIKSVLSLHKPQDITLPNGEWGINCSYCDLWTFPCPTIQAIEKELQ